MYIQPIQTRYKGYHFRSRLEARWAVFLDAMNIEWEYEKESIRLPDGSLYLPDFFLPEFHRTRNEHKGCWLECKASEDTIGINKMRSLFSKLASNPWNDDDSVSEYREPPPMAYPYVWLLAKGQPSYRPVEVFYWDESDSGSAGPIETDGQFSVKYVERKRKDFDRYRLYESCGYGDSADFESVFRHDMMLVRAINAARSARFEHGECGAT